MFQPANYQPYFPARNAASNETKLGLHTQSATEIRPEQGRWCEKTGPTGPTKNVDFLKQLYQGQKSIFFWFCLNKRCAVTNTKIYNFYKKNYFVIFGNNRLLSNTCYLMQLYLRLGLEILSMVLHVHSTSILIYTIIFVLICFMHTLQINVVLHIIDYWKIERKILINISNINMLI